MYIPLAILKPQLQNILVQKKILLFHQNLTATKKFSAKKPAVKIAKVPASSKYRIHKFIMAKLCTQNGHQHTKLKLRSNFTWHKHLNYF